MTLIFAIWRQFSDLTRCMVYFLVAFLRLSTLFFGAYFHWVSLSIFNPFHFRPSLDFLFLEIFGSVWEVFEAKLEFGCT